MLPGFFALFYIYLYSQRVSYNSVNFKNMSKLYTLQR